MPDGKEDERGTWRKRLTALPPTLRLCVDATFCFGLPRRTSLAVPVPPHAIAASLLPNLRCCDGPIEHPIIFNTLPLCECSEQLPTSFIVR